MTAGRPPKYETAEELEDKLEEYFTGCSEEEKRPTITKLVLFLGFCDRASFYDLEKQEKFSHTIKRARTLIESVYEDSLLGTTAAGAIFALKNFGWTDKQQIEHTDGQSLHDATTEELEQRLKDLEN